MDSNPLEMAVSKLIAGQDKVPGFPNLAGFHDFYPGADDMLATVLNGLSQPSPSLPSKYFYDETGSQLFEEICRLDEYYITRTEIRLLHQIGQNIADHIGPSCRLIEFGSGASEKVRTLLEALDRIGAYIPIDISRDHLLAASDNFAGTHPEIPVVPVCADYTQPLDLAEIVEAEIGKAAMFFPGSTIGNFSPEDAKKFLSQCAGFVGHGGIMVIGVDIKKDPALIHAAYNDSKGVTAEFTLNILAHINRILDADFDIDAFAHVAFYNEQLGRIETYIESQKEQSATVGGTTFKYAAGDRIHTEYSYKYSIQEFQEFAAACGFGALDVWTDEDDLFSIHCLEVL